MSRPNNGVNKSQAVRDALARNPNAKSSEIVTELSKNGIKVAPSLVYMVKSVAKNKKRRQRREAAAAVSASMPATNPVALILKVRELSAQAGGIRYLKQLVDVLAE